MAKTLHLNKKIPLAEGVPEGNGSGGTVAVGNVWCKSVEGGNDAL